MWRSCPASQPLQINVFQFDRGTLIQKSHGDHKPLLTLPAHHRAFHAPQGTASHPNRLTLLESCFRGKRHFAVDEPLDAAEVVIKHSLVGNGKPAGDRVGGKRRTTLVVIDE